MAPRNMSTSEYSRYSLRTSKQQSSIRRHDATEVSNKIDFLNMLGLTFSNVFNGSTICSNCYESDCDCAAESGGASNSSNPVTDVRPCSVVIKSEKCTVCGKNFKCQTDVDDHTRRKHGRKSRKIRVVSRIGGEIITERYVKRKYLSLSNRNRYLVDPKPQDSGNKNVPNSFVVPDTPEASDCEGHIQNQPLEFSNFSLSIQEGSASDKRACSAPSLGLRFELPVCQDNCDCCVENIIKTKMTNDPIQATSQDQNNNSCNNNNVSNERISNYEDNSETDEIQCCAKSVSVQTPSWLEHQTLLEYSKAFTTNSKEKGKHTHPIPMGGDDIVDITSEKNFPIDDNFPMEESGDCEIEEILRITRKEPIDVVDLSEEDDKKPLLISDAIRALINTETSMHDFDDFTEKEMEVEDDDLSYVLQLSPNENELRFQEYEDTKLRDNENENDGDDDEDDVSIIPLDPEERNYTFNVKEANEDFNYEKFRKFQLDDASMEKTYFNELDNKSKSWETSKIDRDRFTITSLPNFAACDDTNSFILIKEELMIDHYSFNSDCE